ncbi:mechanosensitive ion channel family protein [Acidicapsa ligni]|uniref:mechanosensitive ion channel family protein n=1 Tax=Acidicapsa ligni TaxID=542300 RepID=UPI0021DF4376|nr:mechanosensitive ion channel family protein [Acidicapsa ligni]
MVKARIILLYSLSLLLCVPAFAQTSSQPAQNSQTPSAVVVGDQTLFSIRTRLGPFSAPERAEAATKRLENLVKDVEINPDTVTADQHETSTDIVSGDLIITTVTESDAQAAGIERSVLANNYIRQIRSGLAQVRAEYTYKSLLLGALYAALTTLALILLLVLLSWLARKLYKRIERWHGTHIRTVRIQSLELISAERLTAIILQCARTARWAITLLLFYFYIPLVFSFFPWTRTFGSTLLSYIFSPVSAGWNSFVAYFPSLLILLVITCFAYFAIRILRFVFKELERGTIAWPGFYPEWAMPTYKILQILTVAFCLVIMFPYLPGSESPAFKGVSIFIGVLLSLGSSSAVANIVAGVILTYTRAFRIGDRVQIAETIGDVVGKTLLATNIRTIKNVHITIPNSLVLGSHIINFSSSTEAHALILHTSVTIGYDAPWRQIHQLLISAATATPGLLQEPRPFVLQTALDDFYVAYEINAYTNDPSHMATIYSDLHQSIQDAFNDAGVEIMSPHYNAVRDGNTIAIPETNRPLDYEAPSFKVSAAVRTRPSDSSTHE